MDVMGAEPLAEAELVRLMCYLGRIGGKEKMLELAQEVHRQE